MIEYRDTDKVSKAQKATDHKKSLFQDSTHSKPVLGNRKPISNVYSKPPLASEEEIKAVEKQFSGEEIDNAPVIKSAEDEAAEAVKKVAAGKIKTVKQAEAVAGLWATAKGYK